MVAPNPTEVTRKDMGKLVIAKQKTTKPTSAYLFGTCRGFDDRTILRLIIFILVISDNVQ